MLRAALQPVTRVALGSSILSGVMRWKMRRLLWKWLTAARKKVRLLGGVLIGNKHG